MVSDESTLGLKLAQVERSRPHQAVVNWPVVVPVGHRIFTRAFRPRDRLGSDSGFMESHASSEALWTLSRRQAVPGSDLAL